MSGKPAAESAWIRRFHPVDDPRDRLVCFPHAGGSASYYYPLSDAMSSSTEVLALQYPGRQDRRAEPLIDNIPALADQVFTALRPWADRPMTLFGHSMGATLAFEVALRMELVGISPLCLFVSGRRAPSTRRNESVHKGTDDAIVAELQKLSGTASELLGDEELLRMVMPAIRSDYKAIETYRYEPGPKLKCPVHALVGDSDPKATPAEERAWAAHTEGEFTCQVFPGGHFYLNNHQSEIINLVSDRIVSTTGGIDVDTMNWNVVK
jgi:surfactin synthase thioesterase subunit